MLRSLGLAADAGDGFLGPRMLLLAFLGQNLVIGLTFGSFGTSVLAIQATFHTSRTLASLGLSLVILAICCTSPFIGARLERWTIRRTMLCGVLLGLAGYLLLSVASSIQALLAIYAFLIGPSLALSSTLVTSTLAANWYVAGRGRALGIVNMPVAVMLVPLVSVAILQRYGLHAVFLAVAAAHVPLLLIATLVVDRPEQVGQRPLGEAPCALAPVSTGPVLTDREIVRQPAFWLLTFAIGMIVGAGAMKIAHMVPLMVEMHRSLDEATLLLAISGGAGMFGSLLFGWLADRLGGALALALNAGVQGVVWIILLLPVGMPLLLVDASVVGLCGGGISSAQGVLFGRLYGTANFARIFGLISFSTVPFLFGMTPLAGLLYDYSGTYLVTIGATVLGLFLAGACFASLRRRESFALLAQEA